MSAGLAVWLPLLIVNMLEINNFEFTEHSLYVWTDVSYPIDVWTKLLTFC